MSDTYYEIQISRKVKNPEWNKHNINYGPCPGEYIEERQLSAMLTEKEYQEIRNAIFVEWDANPSKAD